MTTTTTPEAEDMAKPKAQKTTPVRLTDEAIKWARIASGYTGESMSEFVSRLVEEHGREIANKLHAQMNTIKPPKVKGGPK